MKAIPTTHIDEVLVYTTNYFYMKF